MMSLLKSGAVGLPLGFFQNHKVGKKREDF